MNAHHLKSTLLAPLMQAAFSTMLSSNSTVLKQQEIVVVYWLYLFRRTFCGYYKITNILLSSGAH